MARPRRRFGQHFLTNARILDRIADTLDPAPGDQVLEIGPGHGALTRALLARHAAVTVIEIDRDLVPPLRVRFPGIQVIEGDALGLDWHRLIDVVGGSREQRAGSRVIPSEAKDLLSGSEILPSEFRSWLVTGNIPYNITSPLLDKALTPPRPSRIVFLVQKEVADRVTAGPGGKEYGSLTVGVQAVANAERLFTVPAGAFHPVPRVDSAVIRLTPLPEPLVPDESLGSFRRMVTGLFGFRRKQLVRGVRELTGWPADDVLVVLARLELEPTHRPEVLSPAQFAALHRALVDGGWRIR